jgi:hypothetical protein
MNPDQQLRVPGRSLHGSAGGPLSRESSQVQVYSPSVYSSHDLDDQLRVDAEIREDDSVDMNDRYSWMSRPETDLIYIKGNGCIEEQSPIYCDEDVGLSDIDNESLTDDDVYLIDTRVETQSSDIGDDEALFHIDSDERLGHANQSVRIEHQSYHSSWVSYVASYYFDGGISTPVKEFCRTAVHLQRVEKRGGKKAWEVVGVLNPDMPGALDAFDRACLRYNAPNNRRMTTERMQDAKWFALIETSSSCLGSPIDGELADLVVAEAQKMVGSVDRYSDE